MAPSRKLVSTFVGVFIIGGIVGALVFWMFQDARFSRFLTLTGNPTTMAAHINQKYVKEYDLTPDEQTRVAPLTTEMTQDLYRIRRQFGIDIVSTLKDYHEKIGAQMTPEHRQAFQQANVEREKRMSALLLIDDAPAGQK
jgi:uncharacterized membrane protein